MKRIIVNLYNGNILVSKPYVNKDKRTLFYYPEYRTIQDFRMLNEMMILNNIKINDINMWHVEEIE